jgi:hypothetical protein
MADLISALVRGGARVDGVDGLSPLRWARRSAIEPLVAAGVRLDLCTAASLGRLDEVARFLGPDGSLRPGAKLGRDAWVSDAEIQTEALCRACGNGHLSVVSLLLGTGAHPDARAAEGMTALHHAVWGVHLPVIRLLLERGASLEIENDYGGTPLDFLVWVVRHQYKPGLDYAGAARLLVEAGADVGAVDGLPTGRAEVDRVFSR